MPKLDTKRFMTSHGSKRFVRMYSYENKKKAQHKAELMRKMGQCVRVIKSKGKYPDVHGYYSSTYQIYSLPK